jgi:hypothetical protein
MHDQARSQTQQSLSEATRREQNTGRRRASAATARGLSRMGLTCPETHSARLS